MGLPHLCSQSMHCHPSSVRLIACGRFRSLHLERRWNRVAGPMLRSEEACLHAGCTARRTVIELKGRPKEGRVRNRGRAQHLRWGLPLTVSPPLMPGIGEEPWQPQPCGTRGPGCEPRACRCNGA